MIVSKSAPVIRRIASSRNIVALNFIYPQTSINTLVQRVSPISNLSSGLISNQHYASRWMSNYSSSETIKDPDESEFDKAVGNLTLDLTNVLNYKITPELYNRDIVLEDKLIRNETYNGLHLYMKNMNLLKIVAHLKFVYVRPHITRVITDSDTRTVVVDWKFVGLTTLGLAIRYIPERLWHRANMDNAAKLWFEGTSTFYMDDKMKIFKHVVDKRQDSSQDQTLQQMRNSVSNKQKLKI